MNDFHLLIDLHRDAPRLGPGSDSETELALRLCGLDFAAPLRIADIGCGTGASTLLLARLLPNAHITAVDLFPEFLDTLASRAHNAHLTDRITPLAASMDELPLPTGTFDVLWSEGAIYSIGFDKGIAAWRPLLRPGGLLVLTEITWTTHTRPPELQQHWEKEYPGIATASTKLHQLESNGYSPLAYHSLPESCWLDEYYHPLQARLPAFLNRHAHSPEARAIAEAEQREITLYETHRAHYSYGLYIARKTSPLTPQEMCAEIPPCSN